MVILLIQVSAGRAERQVLSNVAPRGRQRAQILRITPPLTRRSMMLISLLSIPFSDL